jgi:hypothetical protein
MANIVQGTKGDLGIEGDPSYPVGFVNVSYVYDSSFDGKDIFVAARDFVVKGISVRPKIAGTDTGTVSMTVGKCADGATDTAITAFHSSTINVKGTINTVQHATLTASATQLLRGQSITLDATGTTTAAKGLVTVLLAPK